jgi:hypothetical protein
MAVWKVHEEMIADLRKRGLGVPERIMNDLKSAKTLIKISEAGPNDEETVQRIEFYLANIESYLISEGEKQFGTEYVDEWLKQLGEAVKKFSEEDEEEEARFVPGLPRGHRWIRVKPSDKLPVEKLRELAEASQLACRMQSGSILLVYGKDDHLKDFVKKMTARYSSKDEE